MQKKRSNQKSKGGQDGYAGLLVILLATAILAFLYMKSYFSPAPQPVVTEQGDIVSTTSTGIEAAHAQIDSARAMQEKMNQQNKEINQAMGE